MLTIVIAGFILGFAGSLHCVGMCGPLSMALPTHHLPTRTRVIALFVYQVGRIITYSLLGLVFGLAGRGLYLAGMQQWFSISLGIFVLFIATIYFIHERNFNPPFLKQGYTVITRVISSILKKSSGLTGFLLLGMANGLLPCGMVYIALAASLSFHELYQPVSFMVMFGLGTLPAMMLIAYSATVISPATKKLFKLSIPYFIAAIGIVLILRGLHLGIPYLSPQLSSAGTQIINCHP